MLKRKLEFTVVCDRCNAPGRTASSEHDAFASALHFSPHIVTVWVEERQLHYCKRCREARHATSAQASTTLPPAAPSQTSVVESIDDCRRSRPKSAREVIDALPDLPAHVKDSGRSTPTLFGPV